MSPVTLISKARAISALAERRALLRCQTEVLDVARELAIYDICISVIEDQPITAVASRFAPATTGTPYACHVHGVGDAYFINGRFPACRTCLEHRHGGPLSGGERL